MDSVIFDNTRVENAINTIVNDISSNCYIISNNLDNIYSTLNDWWPLNLETLNILESNTYICLGYHMDDVFYI